MLRYFVRIRLGANPCDRVCLTIWPVKNFVHIRNAKPIYDGRYFQRRSIRISRTLAVKIGTVGQHSYHQRKMATRRMTRNNNSICIEVILGSIVIDPAQSAAGVFYSHPSEARRTLSDIRMWAIRDPRQPALLISTLQAEA